MKRLAQFLLRILAFGFIGFGLFHFRDLIARIMRRHAPPTTGSSYWRSEPGEA